MKIRRALITDIFELSRLWSYMALEHDAKLKPDLEMWRGYVVGLMNYSGYFMFVAEEENHIVGFIDYAMTPEPGRGTWTAMINFFYVLPEHREKDVSGQLWKKAIESARENKAADFASICFPEKLDFWKDHGFRTECLTIRRVI